MKKMIAAGCGLVRQNIGFGGGFAIIMDKLYVSSTFDVKTTTWLTT
jgi:hypothetical protein